MTAKQKADVLLDALKQIREMGYDSTAARCTHTVLAVVRVAEEAIANVENTHVVIRAQFSKAVRP